MSEEFLDSDSAASPTSRAAADFGAAAAGAKPCYCYVCACEGLATVCADFELRCVTCSSTCVERIDSAACRRLAHQGLAPRFPLQGGPGSATTSSSQPQQEEQALSSEDVVPAPTAVPAASGSLSTAAVEGSRPCYCYVCACEGPAAECADLELRCVACRSTCVERLDSAAGRGQQAPSPEASVEQTMVHALRRAARREAAQRRRQLGPITPRLQRGIDGLRHLGVICDGCHMRDFPGIRYRCLRCRDFDLCATCHARRAVLHPGHPFETIHTPRTPASSLVADLMARAATRMMVVAIIEIGREESEAQSGLDDTSVAWWLADDERLMPVEQLAEEDPGWCCPICSEGLEAEGSNGWVVQICNGSDAETSQEAAVTSSSSSDPSGSQKSMDDERTGAKQSSEGGGGAPSPKGPMRGAHVYHESCLRKWLVKRNSCPVCRRAPVIPEQR